VLDSYGFTTDALITHASGGLSYEDEWRVFQDQFFVDDRLRNSVTDCPELTIVTYSTCDEPTLLERCLEHLGVRNLVVLRPDAGAVWRFAFKVSLVHGWLQSGQCQTEYIMALDADDLLVFGDPAEMVRRFKEYSCQLLLGSDDCNYPPDRECDEFENEVNGSFGQEWRHINSGGYIAQRDYLAARLADIIPHIDERHPQWWARLWYNDRLWDFDDQLSWRQMHRLYYPEIRTDSKPAIFSRFNTR
jgi:hypothetical protein